MILAQDDRGLASAIYEKSGSLNNLMALFMAEMIAICGKNQEHESYSVWTFSKLVLFDWKTGRYR